MIRTIITTTLILFAVTTQNSFGQMYPALERALERDFPVKPTVGSQWVFYSCYGNIKRIEKPLIKEAAPTYDCYVVSLTNYLGYHITNSDCVVLFDSVKSKIILVEPVWYSGISEPLIKLFLNKRFSNKDKLLNFLNELHELIENDLDYRFVNTSVQDGLITYDLLRYSGVRKLLSPKVISSSLNYTNSKIFRHIEITTKDLMMVEYVAINPILKDREVYKETTR